MLAVLIYLDRINIALVPWAAEVAVLGALLGMAMASTTTYTGSTCPDEFGLVQFQKSRQHLTVSQVAEKHQKSSSQRRQKSLNLKHAEELEHRLRQMAMGKVKGSKGSKGSKGAIGSAQPDYTVFRLDENESEATLQIITDSMQAFLDQVNTSFQNDLLEIQYMIQTAERCNDVLLEQQETLNLNVTSVNDDVVAAEHSHDQCRVAEKVTYDANVSALNELKIKLDSQLNRADPVAYPDVYQAS